MTIGSVNANFEQLKAGLAWYYRDYAADVSPENRALYEAAEVEAKEAKRGLWRDVNPIAPWVHRGESKAPATTAPAPTSTGRPRGLLGSAVTSAIEIRGNRSSKIYHVPGCRNYDDIAMRNRVIFKTEAEALAAGYRKARNCG